jgi:hypothetical protein
VSEESRLAKALETVGDRRWEIAAVVFGLALAGFLIALGLGFFSGILRSESNSTSNANTSSPSERTVEITTPDTAPKRPHGFRPIPEQYRTYKVAIPDSVFDRLGPAPEKGLSGAQVALIAAGVTIVVAIITLTGVWTTVKDKWTDDRISDIWDRFVWVVEPSHARFLTDVERRAILAPLQRKAKELKDTSLEELVRQWREESLDDEYKKIHAAAEKAINVLMSVREMPSLDRKEVAAINESITGLQPFAGPSQTRLLLPVDAPLSGQTVPSPASGHTETLEAPGPGRGATREGVLDTETAELLHENSSQLSERRRFADNCTREALSSIAGSMPDYVDRYAKSIAYQQSDAWKRLDQHQIDDMRAELRDEAHRLAQVLVASQAQIGWRQGPDAAAAVTAFLSEHVRRFDAILERYGYRTTPPGLSPYGLLDPRRLDEAEQALAILFEREKAVQGAQVAADRMDIDHRWLAAPVT